MNSNNQPCSTYPWCWEDHVVPGDPHVGVIGTLAAGDTSLQVQVAVDVSYDDQTQETKFGAQIGDWDLEPGRIVERIRDLRVIANKLEALLTTWKPENAAVTL